jgi:recombination protein RecT
MTDVATLPKGKPPLVVFRDRLEQRKAEIKNSLPSDVSADAFIRAATTSAQLNPEILACTWQSLWNACIRAARAGLVPDGEEGAIVPFKSQAQWIPMVQGILRRFRRSGQFRWITADVVREGEVFEHWITHEGEHFRHVPGDNFQAPIIKAYAIASTKDGATFVTVMTLAEINKHRAFSRAQRDDSPWNTWFESMAIKTAIHKLGKMLPSARDLLPEDDSIPQITFGADDPSSGEERSKAPEGGGTEPQADEPSAESAAQAASSASRPANPPRKEK